MMRGNLLGQPGEPESSGAPIQNATEEARRIGGDPSPSAVSGDVQPGGD